jgi:hypothetical protein
MSESENPEDKGKRILKVEVKTDQALKEAIEENALLKAKIADQEELQKQIALETFERIRGELARSNPEYSASISTCHTPEALSIIQQEIEEKRKANYRAPSGKSTIGYTGNSGGETFENQTVMIDELYRRAYGKSISGNYTREQVEDAKKKISTLLQSTIESKAFHQAFREGQSQKLRQHSFEACPKCDTTILDSEYPCSHCGWDPRKKGDPYIFHGPETKESKF